jgi:hypothetical protein
MSSFLQTFSNHLQIHISGRQTPGSTRGSPPFYITNVGGELRVKTGVWRPEMWAQYTVNLNLILKIYIDTGIWFTVLYCTVHCIHLKTIIVW